MKRIKIRYIIIIIAALFLLLNEGSRTLARRFVEQQKLKKYIKSARYQNSLHKKTLHYLETEPSYFESMARRELHVIAPGEIEYRFHTIDDESESKTKGKENSKNTDNKKKQ